MMRNKTDSSASKLGLRLPKLLREFTIILKATQLSPVLLAKFAFSQRKNSAAAANG
jgi:hypothetical protein